MARLYVQYLPHPSPRLESEMSTLNSTNMNVSRPTTKVRHAPGGSSSINLSFDEQPVAAKGGFKPVFEASNEIAPEPVVEVRLPVEMVLIPLGPSAMNLHSEPIPPLAF